MASKAIGKATNLIPKDPAGTAKTLLQRITKPWTITGPTATPEFLESVPDATDYRKFAPATVPVRPAVPHAETDKVFDIKYYTRDRKRSGTVTVVEMDPAVVAAEMQGLPPTPGNGRQYVMGQPFHMDDEPGEGYQK